MGSFKSKGLPRVRENIWRDLPPSDVKRWTPTKKKAVVVALKEEGRPKITSDAVCQRYDISPEELAAWEYNWQKYGIEGLKVTRAPRKKAA